MVNIHRRYIVPFSRVEGRYTDHYKRLGFPKFGFLS